MSAFCFDATVVAARGTVLSCFFTVRDDGVLFFWLVVPDAYVCSEGTYRGLVWQGRTCAVRALRALGGAHVLRAAECSAMINNDTCSWRVARRPARRK